MRYFVPQIQHQTKIGGLNFKQSGFVIGGITLCLIVLFISPASVLYASVPIMGISLFLGFAKVRDMDITTFIKNWWMHLFGPKIYHWKKNAIITKPIQSAPEPPPLIKKRETVLEQRQGKLFNLSQKNI